MKSLVFAAALYLAASVAALAAEPLRISGPLVAGGFTGTATISPDGSRVVFGAVKDSRGVYELYSVPTTGEREPVKLSGMLASSSTIFRHAISPDGKRVVFGVETNSTGATELFSAPIGGGADPVRLSGALVAGGNVSLNSSIRISADSRRVVFVADKETDGVFELYSAPIDGASAPIKLSGRLLGDAYVSELWVAISSDSARVVFTDGSGATGFTLRSVPIAGGAAPLKLSDRPVGRTAISPDGTTVLFVGFEGSGSALYSVSIAGGAAPVKLSESLNNIGSISMSPDGIRVAFTAAFGTALYTAPTAGGAAPVRISVDGQAGIAGFQFTPDGTRVVFIANRGGANELYSANAMGGPPTKLSGVLVAGGGVEVTPVLVTPDSMRVVFVADKEKDNRFELYSVAVAGGTEPVQLSGATASTGAGRPAFFVQLTPDGSRVVFAADKDQDLVRELYSVPIGGGAAPVKHSGKPYQIGVGAFAITPDSSRVVFSAPTASSYDLLVTAFSLAMDIDGNGVVDALTDSILFFRWNFGLRGAPLVANAIGSNATRTTAAQIEAYLSKLDAHPAPK